MTIPTPPPVAKKPDWSPRMWEGCNTWSWFRLLAKNRFAVQWRYWYIAVIVTFSSTLHTLLGCVQAILFGRAIRNTALKAPPIFILGHWRNGTTLLHELLIQDTRHGYPTTYECMDPNHFLLTEKLFSKYLKFLVPKSRPMDNMKAGFDRPQEDEFALCMLGYPSPYLSIAFPNHPPMDPEYLDLESVSPAKLASWKQGLLWLLKAITYKQGKHLVLKSPTHTARIKVLKEMFPDSLFIHIIRDPYVVFPSTVNLWRTLYRTHGMQTPTYDGVEEGVFSTYLRVHEKLEEGKTLLAPGQFYELRYEDLVKNPVEEVRKIYDHFQLEGFSQHALPNLEGYVASVKGYETNKYQLTPEQRAEIERRWGGVIRQYGYAKENQTNAP